MMKKLVRLIFAELIISLCFVFNGCKDMHVVDSYDEMLQDYNSKYFTLTPTPPIEKRITDSNFNQDSMLEFRYTFIEGYEATLVAPLGGAKYSWIKLKHDGTFEDSPVCEKRIYDFVPEKDFEINTETKLVLTVTDESGTEYIDTTLIVVLNNE